MDRELLIDDEVNAALTDLSAQLGISQEEVLRRAVLDMRERVGHRANVARSASKVALEYAEALDRLGKA